jgi:CheY-like chemotaxis protein
VNDGPSKQTLLCGLTVLLVEDETLISFLIEDMLRQLGCSDVWHVSAVGQALSILRQRRPDVAVLDVNLGGEPVYPVVERLAAAEIPFVFATGYGRTGLPQQWNGRPVVQKPFALEALAAALGSALRD